MPRIRFEFTGQADPWAVNILVLVVAVIALAFFTPIVLQMWHGSDMAGHVVKVIVSRCYKTSISFGMYK